MYNIHVSGPSVTPSSQVSITSNVAAATTTPNARQGTVTVSVPESHSAGTTCHSTVCLLAFLLLVAVWGTTNCSSRRICRADEGSIIHVSVQAHVARFLQSAVPDPSFQCKGADSQSTVV